MQTQTSKNFDQTDFEHWQNILSTAKLKVGFPLTKRMTL